jgi:hypothetical protein
MNEEPMQTLNSDDPLQHWLLIDGDIASGEKRKRKACDCPNCIRFVGFSSTF